MPNHCMLLVHLWFLFHTVSSNMKLRLFSGFHSLKNNKIILSRKQPWLQFSCPRSGNIMRRLPCTNACNFKFNIRYFISFEKCHLTTKGIWARRFPSCSFFLKCSFDQLSVFNKINHQKLFLPIILYVFD